MLTNMLDPKLSDQDTNYIIYFGNWSSKGWHSSVLLKFTWPQSITVLNCTGAIIDDCRGALSLWSWWKRLHSNSVSRIVSVPPNVYKVTHNIIT